MELERMHIYCYASAIRHCPANKVYEIALLVEHPNSLSKFHILGINEIELENC